MAASSSRFAPFIKSVSRNQAATLEERSAVRRCFIDGLSSGVDGPISDLWVFGPIGNESPLEGVQGTRLSLGIEPDRKNLLARSDIVTDRQIRLA